jgi:hypothetical protein
VTPEVASQKGRVRASGSSCMCRAGNAYGRAFLWSPFIYSGPASDPPGFVVHAYTQCELRNMRVTRTQDKYFVQQQITACDDTLQM